MKNFIKNEIDYWKSVILARKNARLMKYLAEYTKYNYEIETAKSNNDFIFKMLEMMSKIPNSNPSDELLRIVKEKTNGNTESKGQKDGNVGSGDSGHNC